MDLQAFILRAKVLKLYRDSLRVATRSPAHARRSCRCQELLLHHASSFRDVGNWKCFCCGQASKVELRRTMRLEMEKNRGCRDKQKIRFFLSEGLRRLKELREMLDMQGHG